MQKVALGPGDYWGIVKRRKWSLMVSAALVLFIAVAIAFVLPPIYSSYSTILIEEQQIPTEFVMTTVNTYAEQRVHNIKQRVLSFTQLHDIIKEQKLYSELKDKWTPEEIVAKMRGDVRVKMLSADVFDRRTGRPVTVTTAFTVGYEGKSPQAVLRVTDTLTSLFLEQNLQVRQKRVSETSEFLSSEVQRVKEDLAQAEKEVANYKQAHINELPELFQVNKQSLDVMERSIEQLRGELRHLKEREGYLATQLAAVSPSMDDATARSREAATLKDLHLQLAGMLERYTEAYPDVAIVRAQIAAIEKQTDSGIRGRKNVNEQADNPAYVNLESQLAGTKADIEMMKKQMQAMQERVSIYRKRIEETPRVEGDYLALVSQRNALQGKYNDLTAKYQEAKVAQELEREQKGERFSLIEPARLPETPTKPNRLAIVLVGAVLSVGVGTCFAAVREMADPSIRNSDLLASLVGAPVLATIPRIVTPEERMRQRKRRVYLWGIFAVLLILTALFVHFYVIDFDVLWAKVMRRLAKL